MPGAVTCPTAVFCDDLDDEDAMGRRFFSGALILVCILGLNFDVLEKIMV